MICRRVALLVVAAGFTSPFAAAETLEIALRANQPAELIIDSAVDGENFRDPRGYLQHGTRHRVFQRRLTLTNTGSTPLTGPLLIVNRQDRRSLEGLRESLNLRGSSGEWMPRLLSFWSDHFSHADADIEGGKEPLALLNFWGFALCGDTTSALTRLATALQVPARKIPLNGHVAAEYFYGNAWHIFDADQKICYPRWDNRTLASASDLRADPLLARRVKPLGRYAVLDPAAMAFNAALHEFIDPQEGKPVKSKTPPMPVRAETLFPGEQLIFHDEQAPEPALSRANLNRWGAVCTEALRVVEFVILPHARGKAAGQAIVFASGLPILRAENRTTGETIRTPPDRATFELSIPTRTLDDKISVFCQCSEIALPRVRRGRNTILLAAENAAGAARLAVDWERPPTDLIVPKTTVTLAAETPVFHVASEPAADLVWWQVSALADFTTVLPNLDQIAPLAERVLFDPLTATFLNPGQPYSFRAKSRHAGVWGEWSATQTFQIAKPERPAPVALARTESRLRLTWPDGGADCEYLVFGSNRRDFVPDVLAEEEIVALRDQLVTERRPNKNFVAAVKEPEIEFEPACRFYRVLTRRAGVLSVPGDLLVTPPELAGKLPPVLILQTRWRRVPDPQNPGAETDEYIARELPLR